jgi:hypothetical protein
MQNDFMDDDIDPRDENQLRIEKEVRRFVTDPRHATHWSRRRAVGSCRAWLTLFFI